MNTEKIFEIFREINNIPRASHHEAEMADYLCRYAENLGLDYDRDTENNVVIRKPATPGMEHATPVVLLNHMDMVAIGDGTRPFNPLTDKIEAYEEDGWIKARGTSLGADNGIGLSMALLVVASDNIAHGPLEVLTTTNEEDGMSGAANMSPDFIKGRKVINLDSEDYDTITIGAAGAYIQKALFPIERHPLGDDYHYYKIEISGGLGGHSGVDINKGRINAIYELCHTIHAMQATGCPSLHIADINGGDANASIPGSCTAIIAIHKDEAEELLQTALLHDARIRAMYEGDPHISLSIEATTYAGGVITSLPVANIINSLPCGVIEMHPTLPHTPMTSNNIGVIRTAGNHLTITTHTRSFDNASMTSLAHLCAHILKTHGADVEVVMNTPSWEENADSPYINLVSNAFQDTLGFRPHKVAMHFVLEAGYYVQKFPGIEIACIGPRIIDPHSTNEKVEKSTIDNIYRVLVEVLRKG